MSSFSNESLAEISYTDPISSSNSKEIESFGYVAVVDPFSAGAVLASALYQAGFKVIAVYSASLESLANLLDLIPEGLDISYVKTVGFDPDISSMCNSILEGASPLLGVLVGTETGVSLADILSEHLGLRTNGTQLLEARRNKYVMGETIRAAGVRAVKQLRASTWQEIQEYLEDWAPTPFKVVVKPVDSAGSDGVALCHNIQHVKRAFHAIIGQENVLGLVNRTVLVQEYLDGQEYVVDTVSRDGEHKVVAIMTYDKRNFNGADFVYFHEHMHLVNDDSIGPALVEYAKKVLDAVGIKNGASHGEYKLCNGEPVLVEIGSRCHGAEGAWREVTNAVYGYDQIGACIDAYFFPEKFAALPPVPSTRKAHGRLVFVHCNARGILTEINDEMLREIQAMESFVRMDVLAKVGQEVTPTIGLFNLGGLLKLVNPTLEGLLRDYDRVREMEDTGLFRARINRVNSNTFRTVVTRRPRSLTEEFCALPGNHMFYI